MYDAHNSGAVVSTPEGIEMLRWSTVRSALKLEILLGMPRSSRGRTTLALANQITGSTAKNKRKAYDALNAHIVAAGGLDRPFPAGR